MFPQPIVGDGEGQMELLDTKRIILRQFFQEHYKLASNNAKSHPPWEQMGEKSGNFFAAEYVPEGFQFRDPTRLKGESVISLVNHLRQRQENQHYPVFCFSHVQEDGKFVDAKYSAKAMIEMNDPCRHQDKPSERTVKMIRSGSPTIILRQAAREGDASNNDIHTPVPDDNVGEHTRDLSPDHDHDSILTGKEFNVSDERSEQEELSLVPDIPEPTNSLPESFDRHCHDLPPHSVGGPGPDIQCIPNSIFNAFSTAPTVNIPPCPDPNDHPNSRSTVPGFIQYSSNMNPDGQPGLFAGNPMVNTPVFGDFSTSQGDPLLNRLPVPYLGEACSLSKGLYGNGENQQIRGNFQGGMHYPWTAPVHWPWIDPSQHPQYQGVDMQFPAYPNIFPLEVPVGYPSYDFPGNEFNYNVAVPTGMDVQDQPNQELVGQGAPDNHVERNGFDRNTAPSHSIAHDIGSNTQSPETGVSIKHGNVTAAPSTSNNGTQPPSEKRHTRKRKTEEEFLQEGVEANLATKRITHPPKRDDEVILGNMAVKKRR